MSNQPHSRSEPRAATTPSTPNHLAAALQAEIRRGAYYDSVLLMQLQRALAALPGVQDAGVVMGTDANKAVLAQSGLLTPETQAASSEDLIVVVAAADPTAATDAIQQIDALLARRTASSDTAYRPKSLESAVRQLPDAHWVLISVPGRYAAAVAQDALRRNLHVFLYSDHVSLEDEIALKQRGAANGLLVMGPDCGTAIVNGFGLGFANRVRAGNIGLIAASGTGLQHVSARIHQMGGGITHALGTGGRDLLESVSGITTLQALDLLQRDANTHVIGIISKPPAPAVAQRVLQAAAQCDKPVVINFIGLDADSQTRGGNLHFAQTLDETAALAVKFAENTSDQPLPTSHQQPAANNKSSEKIAFATGQRYLRGLYSGGTLAYEAQLILRSYLPTVYANAPLDTRYALENATQSHEHTIVDLGEDEFTAGRLHPMLDHELRIQRLQQEANDPETAIILLDVVLGFGAHPDPAAELAPAIAAVRSAAAAAGRYLHVITILVGTDEDPQEMTAQAKQLSAAGAEVRFDHAAAVRRAGELARTLGVHSAPIPVAADLLHRPFAAINVGLESFTESLLAQEAQVVHVDWRPPAGGNAKLAGILARMRGNGK